MKILAALGISLLLLGSPAMAQNRPANDCPNSYVCVEFEGRVIEIDPDLGPYQMLVTRKDTTITETLDGEMSEATVTLTGFVSNGDTYEVRDTFQQSREGVFADADVADVYILTEAE